MKAAIFDTGVVVAVAQAKSFARLRAVAPRRIVTDIVDGEVVAGRDTNPAQVARYDDAIAHGLLAREELVVGSPEYAEFLRLRKRRVNPARNRGEDSCIALSIHRPDSVVYMDDHGGARRAREELGPERVLTSANI